MRLNDSSILAKALSATRSAVAITDCNQLNSSITYCNQAFLDLRKYTRDEVVGQTRRFLQGEDTRRSAFAKILGSIAEKSDCRMLIKNYAAHGKLFWNDLTLSSVFDSRESLTYFFISITSPQLRTLTAAKQFGMLLEVCGGNDISENSRIQNKSTKSIGGTGLELYWAKRVVMLYGGTIEYKRREAKGCDFAAALPRRIESE